MVRSRVSAISGLNLQRQFDLDELRAVNPGVLVVYDHDAARIPEIRAAIPDARICLRLFNDPADAERLAATGYTLAQTYLREGDYLTPFNEPEIEHGWTVEQVALYSRRFVAMWRQWHPALPVRLVSPAISPSGPLRDQLDRLQLGWLDYHVIGVHAYWPRGAPVQLMGPAAHVVIARAVWPDKPVLITECGRAFAHHDSADSAAAAAELDGFLNRVAALPYVEGAAVFLWDSPDPQWRDWTVRGSPLEQTLYWIGRSTEPEPPLSGGGSSLEEGGSMPALQLPVPPWDRDELTFLVWYLSRLNNWGYGANPAEDPRVMEDFVAFVRAVGKDPTDLSKLGAPVWAPAPPQPAPTPTPPPYEVIQTQFGPVSEPANTAIQRAWPRDLWTKAAEVSYLESGWNPRALADTVSRIGPCGTPYLLPDGRRAVSELSAGLFQVNICAHGGTVEELSDPLVNARKGYEIYQRQGWGAWLFSAQKLRLL